MDNDAVFNQALEFLANDGEMPEYIKTAKDKFQAACLREIRSEQNKVSKTLVSHHDRLSTVETVLKLSGLTTMGGGVLLIVLRVAGVL